jgi:O-antigen/teichoic acid export membrane protein
LVRDSPPGLAAPPTIWLATLAPVRHDSQPGAVPCAPRAYPPPARPSLSVSLAKAAAKALVWTSLESFALSGLSLISLVVFARYLSAPEFGLAAIALAIVQTLNLPVEMLFHDAVIQRKDLQATHINSAFTLSVALGTVLCAGCWLFGDMVGRAMGEPHLGSVLRWMSLSLIGMGFGSVLVATQRRKLEFRALALRSLGGRAGSALVAIALAVYGGGVWSLVAQQVLLVCLGTLTLWVLSDERPRFGIAWSATRDLLRFGGLATPRHLLNTLTPRVFMVLVGGYLGSKTAGILSLAFRGLGMLQTLMAGALVQVAMPLFSRLQDDREALFAAYTRSVQLTALVTFPTFVGLALCADEVLLVVFGKQWLEAGPYFVVIALLALVFYVRLYAGPLLTAVGRPAAPNVEFVAQAVFVLVGMLIFGKYSAWAAMAVWTGRLVLSVPIDMWMVRRGAGMSYRRQLQGPLTPLLASGGMACAVLVAKNLLLDSLAPEIRLWPVALLGAAAYGSLILVIDRDLVRQFLSFLGQSIQSGGRA